MKRVLFLAILLVISSNTVYASSRWSSSKITQSEESVRLTKKSSKEITQDLATTEEKEELTTEIRLFTVKGRNEENAQRTQKEALELELIRSKLQNAQQNTFISREELVRKNSIYLEDSHLEGELIDSEYKEIFYDRTISFYCADSICNGQWAGTTAVGLPIWQGMEDPNYVAVPWLPKWTKLELSAFPGRIFTNVDTGRHARLTGTTAEEKETLSPEELENKGRSKGGVDVFSPLNHEDVEKLGLIHNVEVRVLK